MNVDEMNEVRQLRADAPVPDRGRLAPGRARLEEALRGRARTRRLRSDWRIAAGAAAGAVAAITAVTLLATGVGGDGTAGPATPAASRLVLGEPADVLGRIADTVEQGPEVPEPGPTQWTYQRVMRGDAGLWPNDGAATPEPQIQNEWKKYADPRFENGREGDDHSPRERYRFLKALPDDPKGVLRKAREFYPTGKHSRQSQAEEDFGSLRVLLASYPIPPDGLAKVYRALATVPGVEITDHLVRDVAGREAIAIGVRPGPTTDMRDEVLIDPRTYAYAGGRQIAVRDHMQDYPGADDTPDRPWKTGDIRLQNARLAAAVVDKKGQRP
ncbi:CU044_5270 family protein [Streptomyces sp. NPDC052225]|uniref:CU044_5270 family protein n=1 Tax=Streptomyces sp. NPDC052225 TaxID=3154949 RepID=UPI003420C501